MTRQDESAQADADHVMPSTRRSRREGEREAAHRALYSDSAEPSSPMRVADGSAPMYRTRREMRESASRLARDLPVIVEPLVDVDDDAASAPVDEPQATLPAPPSSTPPLPSRRARRLAESAVAPVEADEAHDAAPAPEAPVIEAQPATRPVGAPVRAASTAAAIASIAVDPVASAASDDATSGGATTESQRAAAERAMTRAERRAATAAGSAEVSAAVAAVLGGQQEDAASTPVRSPLHREARAPRPAVVVRRPIATAPVVRPSRRARSSAARKAVQRLGAAGVILAIGSFVAVTSLPAQAFSPSASSAPEAYGDVQVEQQLDVTSGTGAHGDEEVTAVLSREDFNVDDEIASTRLDADEVAELQAVADTDEIGPYYDGEPSMPNVWSQLETSYTQSPFPSLAEVPVSSGFGYRWGSFHGGVDLIPGAGTPVYPIANGVVVAIWQGNNPGGGGYEVIVEHNIDGEFFQSWYPHMTAGSILVEEGQVVDITTQLGAVGSTGRSTGAHLHLEIKNADYVSVDPLVWLATREQILEP